MRRNFGIALLAAVGALSSARAGTEVVLQDGQVIQATEVRRDGDNFVIVLPSGGTATLPAGSVASVRLGDEPPAAPTTGAKPETTGGITYNDKGQQISGPKLPENKNFPTVVSGPDVKAPSVADQQRVLGTPSQFKGDITHQQDWVPSTDWNMDPTETNNWAPSTWAPDIVDSRWEPKSAYDTNKDVLADSRSTFQKGAIDSTWTPTDGFRKEGTSAKVGRAGQAPYRKVETGFTTATVAAAAPAARAMSAWSCGESIFSSGTTATTGVEGELAKSIAVKGVDDKRIAGLPVALYQADGEVAGSPRRAVFSVAGGSCRLVAGDLGPLLGVDIEDELAVSQAASAYNAALSVSGPRKTKIADKVDYAFSLATLTDPDVSGKRGANLVLLSDASQLKRIDRGKPETCALGSGQRKKEARKASLAVKMPKLQTGFEGEIATFYTWSSHEGKVYRNSVLVGRDGLVSVHRDLIAAHIGDHLD